MTRDQAEAGVLLCDALDDMSGFLTALERTEPNNGYVRRIFEMGAKDQDSDGGSETDYWVEVDIETGRLIALAAQTIIRARIKELGMQHPGVE